MRPPGVEKTSRLRSRDPVGSGVKCGPHGGMNSKMKSWTVSWLSLKTKVEPGLRGSQVMSGDWLRLLLTQNVHLAPSTQQAEQAGFTRAKNHKTCQSIFSEN
jgi:hypothetical protein